MPSPEELQDKYKQAQARKDYEAQQTVGSKYRPHPDRPGYTIAEIDDTYETIAARFGVDPTLLAQMNPDISTLTAGGAIDLPQDLSVRPGYTPTPDPRVLLDTAETTPEGIQYPEGWNMAQLQAAVYGGGGVIDFASKLYGGYYTEAAGVPTEELPAWAGLPSTHAWEKDPETGQWARSPQESVFDELYVMNGIDPSDPDMVEWFWGFADEDLLFAGELFGILDFDTDEGVGYGGYGTAPSPSKQYGGSGQKPQRGDYASYLGLSSWSI